jgi:5,10-methenyltetrahydromethanopterin hydrogenase
MVFRVGVAVGEAVAVGAADMWLTWLPEGSMKKSDTEPLSPDTCKITDE